MSITMKREIVLEKDTESEFSKVYSTMEGIFEYLNQEFDWFLAEQFSNDLPKMNKPHLMARFVETQLKKLELWDEAAYQDKWKQESGPFSLTIGEAMELGFIKF